MTSDSTLTLYIPDLFGFQSILSTLSKDELSQLPETRFPILEKWLSRGLVKKSTNTTELLSSEFGIAVDKGHAYAAFSLLAESTKDNTELDSKSFWLRADPVHLQADRDTALLVAYEELELSQDEANKLVNEINQHFSDEPWELHALHPHRWYLKLEQSHDLTTHPLNKALGEDIKQFVSVGDDANYWLKITNEIQMLLHGTNVNFERDSRSMLTANSIWLWGEGCLPDKTSVDCSYDKLFSNNPYYQGIAHFCNIDVYPLTDKLEKQSFVVLDTLGQYVQSRDLYSYMQALSTIEEIFIKQCQNLLDSKKIKDVKLISDHGFSIMVTSKALRRYWKRVKPFTSIK